MAECLVSNLVLDDAVVDPDVAKIDVCTICPNLPLICSRMDGAAYLDTSLEALFLVGLKITVGFVIWRVWRAVALLITAVANAGAVGTELMKS